jgi:hypothetical protein
MPNAPAEARRSRSLQPDVGTEMRKEGRYGESLVAKNVVQTRSACLVV